MFFLEDEKDDGRLSFFLNYFEKTTHRFLKKNVFRSIDGGGGGGGGGTKIEKKKKKTRNKKKKKKKKKKNLCVHDASFLNALLYNTHTHTHFVRRDAAAEEEEEKEVTIS